MGATITRTDMEGLFDLDWREMADRTRARFTRERLTLAGLFLANLALYGLIFYCLLKGVQGIGFTGP